MASKLRDGLFIGDAETSTDPEFLELNKISNLVNLSGRDVPNVWAAHGLVYLTFLWEDNPDFRLFGNMEDCNANSGELYPPPLSEIVDFIDGSLRHGISVLLFSKKGQSRCVVAACAYLMCKYRWGFEKAFDLILSKKTDAAPNKGFIQQLFALDKILLLRIGGLKHDSSDSKAEPFSSSSAKEEGAPLAYLDGFELTLSPKELLRWRSWDSS